MLVVILKKGNKFGHVPEILKCSDLFNTQYKSIVCLAKTSHSCVTSLCKCAVSMAAGAAYLCSQVRVESSRNSPVQSLPAEWKTHLSVIFFFFPFPFFNLLFMFVCFLSCSETKTS